MKNLRPYFDPIALEYQINHPAVFSFSIFCLLEILSPSFSDTHGLKLVKTKGSIGHAPRKKIAFPLSHSALFPLPSRSVWTWQSPICDRSSNGSLSQWTFLIVIPHCLYRHFWLRICQSSLPFRSSHAPLRHLSRTKRVLGMSQWLWFP